MGGALPMLPSMAVSGTVPSRRPPPPVDPVQVARWIRRATVALAVVCIVWLFATVSWRWVPAGMDTVPGIAPGSMCLVDRRASAVAVGRDVFVTTPDGAVVLSRVTAIDPEHVTVINPNPEAPYPDSRVFGALPRDRLRGTVLCVLAPGGTGGGGGK